MQRLFVSTGRIAALALVFLLLASGQDAFLIVAAILIALHVLIDRTAMRATIAAYWHGLFSSILLGAFFGLALSFTMFAIMDPFIADITGKPIDLSQFKVVEGNVEAFIQLLIIGLVIGGIIEEIVYRGYLVGWAHQLLPAIPPVILVSLSAVIFGFAHTYQGISGAISTGMIGFAIGILYILVGRKLLVAVAAHSTVNVVGVTGIYLGYGL